MKPWREGLHTEVSSSNNFYTRKNKMELCNCRLCYLALNPPLTFSDYEAYGLDKIADESRPMTHHAKQTFKWKMYDNDQSYRVHETYTHPSKRK